MPKSALDDLITKVAAGSASEVGQKSAAHLIDDCVKQKGRREFLIAEMLDLAPENKVVVRLNFPEERLLLADSAVQLSNGDRGKQVVLQLGLSDDQFPVVLGLIREGVRKQTAVPDHLVLEARHQIELRCGNSSIVLSGSGKILIRGDYVVSRSTGVNRVDGAAVQIN